MVRVGAETEINHERAPLRALQQAHESRPGRERPDRIHCLKCDLVDPLLTDAVKWAESPLAESAAD